MKGIEFDAAAQVITGLTLRAGGAYPDGRYTDYPAGPCPLERHTSATTGCNLTGRRLASPPRFAVTAGFDYVRPLGGAVTLHVETASRSGYNGDPPSPASLMSTATTLPTPVSVFASIRG